MSNNYEDFIGSINSVSYCSELTGCDLKKLINNLFRLSNEIIIKLNNQNRIYIIKKFIDTISCGIGDFAGAMTEDEFYLLCHKSQENKLSLNHCRKCCNVFWALCKTILSEILFDEDETNILLSYFFSTLEKRVITVKYFFPNLNESLFKEIMSDGISGIELNYGIDENRIINPKLLYEHIIRMTFLDARQISTKMRGNIAGGYDFHKLNCIHHFIMPLLTEEEKNQRKVFQQYPWTGVGINGIQKCEYYNFCKDNDIYFVSGLSGTTFELMLWMIILFKFEDETLLKTIIMLFMHFHIFRGSHSVLEVVWGVYEINKYLNSKNDVAHINLKNILSRVCDKDKIKYSTDLCYNLILGNVDIDNQHYVFFKIES